LNYDIRILGRRGMLKLIVVASMSQLAEVRQASDQVRGLVAYDPGSRYADVDKKNDKMAAYGGAGLVGAAVRAAAVKNPGLLAILLAFAKKGFIVIAAGFAAAAAWFRRVFGRMFGGAPKVQAANPAAPPPDPPPNNGGDIVQ